MVTVGRFHSLQELREHVEAERLAEEVRKQANIRAIHKVARDTEGALSDG